MAESYTPVTSALDALNVLFLQQCINRLSEVESKPFTQHTH
jgi:hypothetical protein